MSTNVSNQLESKLSLDLDDKREIMELIQDAITRYGTASAVAQRCDCSPAAISMIAKNEYKTQGDDMWRKVGHALGWRKAGWNIDPTITNTRTVNKMLQDAQTNSMFMCVSERAGSGKTSGILQYIKNDRTQNSFYIEAGFRESPTAFLSRLRKILAIPHHRNYYPANEQLEQVAYFFKNRKGRPLLVIDQANSLPAQTLTMLLHLYNKLEDRLGWVLSGTEALQQQIERGVKNKRQGYDELEDRLGRAYIKLTGYTFGDAKKMCVANGITNPELHKQLWKECVQVDKLVDVGQGAQQDFKAVAIVESGRVLKRKINKYIMLSDWEDLQISETPSKKLAS